MVIGTWCGFWLAVFLAVSLELDPGIGHWPTTVHVVLFGIVPQLALGLTVGRWRVVLLPILAWLLVSLFAALTSGPCSDCREEMPLELVVVFYGVFFVAPAAATVGLGVGVRSLANGWIARHRRIEPVEG
ncbi:MAG: hypothetical protein QOJ38_1434 [Solirubrobacterales bacterium]|jgi:hypothetical protein|nr:hypothetical protein [Solirubrobacterales bacterium]